MRHHQNDREHEPRDQKTSIEAKKVPTVAATAGKEQKRALEQRHMSARNATASASDVATHEAHFVALGDEHEDEHEERARDHLEAVAEKLDALVLDAAEREGEVVDEQQEAAQQLAQRVHEQQQVVVVESAVEAVGDERYQRDVDEEREQVDLDEVVQLVRELVLEAAEQVLLRRVAVHQRQRVGHLEVRGVGAAPVARGRVPSARDQRQVVVLRLVEVARDDGERVRGLVSEVDGA